jgi:hypothetical protein
MAFSDTIPKILAALQQRRAALDTAIVAMEALAASGTPRRGRKPRALAALSAGAPAQKPRRRLSEETRRKMSEAAKRRAERKKAEQAGQSA